MTITIPRLCASVSVNPHRFGVRMHTAAYEALDLDYSYIAIGSEDLQGVLRFVRSFNVRGLGVSMPHKRPIIGLLDEVDDDVAAIGACNTVVNDGGVLRGHNTDWKGALLALDEAGIEGLRTAVIVGAGGAAHAIAYALKQRGVLVSVAATPFADAELLARKMDLVSALPLEEQGSADADIVVNATPVAAVRVAAHERARVLLDVVPDEVRTEMVRQAERQGLRVAPGWRMLLHQAALQFTLYTEAPAPLAVMERSLLDVLVEPGSA